MFVYSILKSLHYDNVEIFLLKKPNKNFILPNKRQTLPPCLRINTAYLFSFYIYPGIVIEPH